MRRITLILMFLVVLMVFSATANAQKEWLVGNFVATDANTRRITRVTLTADDQIHVWGKCHPSDCDWGLVPVDTYGPNVDADLQTSAKSVSAIYLPGFARTFVIVKPLDENKIQVDVFTKFTDRSGRTPYMIRQILIRNDDMALKP